MYEVIATSSAGEYPFALQDDGTIVALFREERPAQRVAVLLNSATTGAREVSNDRAAGTRFSRGRRTRPTPTPSPSPTPAPGSNMYQDGGPKAGRVYDVLTGDDVGPSGTTAKPTPRPAPEPWTAADIGPEPKQQEDGPRTWRIHDGGTVTAWPSGLAYVRFLSRPTDPTIEDLRAAGFAWFAKRRAWKGREEALPTDYTERACT